MNTKIYSLKKLLFIFMGILLLVSCEKEDIKQEESNSSSNEISTVSKVASKIKVCHYNASDQTWHTINISSNAWPAHKLHGDVRLDDQDGDGYVPNNQCGFGQMGDCNDNNSSVRPGAIEICNGLDDNCNGAIDDNCICIVTICNQQWMCRNLDVTTYRNGDPIPEVTDPAAWAALTTGAWCYYENNSANGTVYGKLYNIYAVNDPRGLAPAGFHIPTQQEFTVLMQCAGGTTLAGGALKETGTSHWLSPNTGATNSTGFIGLPGGLRYREGVFVNLHVLACFWTTTEYQGTFHIHSLFSYDNASFSDNYHAWDNAGLSVRCVRD